MGHELHLQSRNNRVPRREIVNSIRSSYSKLFSSLVKSGPFSQEVQQFPPLRRPPQFLTFHEMSPVPWQK